LGVPPIAVTINHQPIEVHMARSARRGISVLALKTVFLAVSFAATSRVTASSVALAQTAPAETRPADSVGAAPVVAEPAKPPLVFPPASTPLKIESGNGNSLKIGLLLQPQFQMGNARNAALSGWSENVFLRRTRILIGGTLLGGLVDYFVETDSPNLFLASPATDAMGNATTLKTGAGMFIQDAFLTLKPFGDLAKLDVGYMLPPMTHNALQGAGTLYGWDYFANSFRHSDVFGAGAAPVGRDAGLQVRGLVLGNMLEYRVGLFQGLRKPATATEVAARNFLRFTGRVQLNLFDPETGFFYAGTYFGSKKVVSFGASFDVQGSYKNFGVDGFADLPLGPGVLTAQAALSYWDGGSDVPALPKFLAEIVEAGYLLPDLRISPIVRFEHLGATVGNPETHPDETRVSFGGAYWPFAHNLNLKLFYTLISGGLNPSGAGAAVIGNSRTASQINLQLQLYYF